MSSNPIYALQTARALALHAQGLGRPNPPGYKPGLTEIEAAVRQVGAVQIDTLQMVQRSAYLVLWSRLGAYHPRDFDRLVYDPAQRVLFEDWLHAACILPLSEYRFGLPRKYKARQEPSTWYERWLSDGEHVDLMGTVMEHIRHAGPQRANHFKHEGLQRGAWWDWTPSKRALEWLFAYGDLMVSERVNFQRVYDLTERVLPAWVDTSLPSPEEVDRHWIETGVRCLGICSIDQAATYTYRRLSPTRLAAGSLLADGTLRCVNVRLLDGSVQEMVVHRDHLALLEQAADGALPARRTTFLSFFDSLFWAKDRDAQFWGFHNHLEAYTPAAKRVYGYYCMPILHHDRIVGRFDPKLERKQGLLALKALYLEPGVEPDEELVAGVAEAMRDFLHFHKASQLVIERSQPAGFGEKLLAAL